MFIEPNIITDRRGWIEVICGSMFSGKTEELIRRLKRARIANLEVAIFKPAVDVRYDVQNIVSHDENIVPSRPIEFSRDILTQVNDALVVGIDEAQFFDNQLADVCESLALRGLRVIVAGLDMDFAGEPFGPVPSLLAKADYITKLHAICVCCGQIANFSYRRLGGNEQVLLGKRDTYEPRCRVCYQKGDLLS